MDEFAGLSRWCVTLFIIGLVMYRVYIYIYIYIYRYRYITIFSLVH